MTKVTLKELRNPSWFKLANYSGLLYLKPQELLDEWRYRANFYRELEDTDELIDIFPNSSKWRNIMAGNPIDSLGDESLDTYNNFHLARGVSALTNQQLNVYSIAAQVEEEQLRKTSLNNDFCSTNTAEELLEYTLDFSETDTVSGNYLLSLDLESYTNSELEAHFSGLLLKLRKDSNIPEPVRKKVKSGESFFTNIISSNLIPYMDLRLWSIYLHVKDNVHHSERIDGRYIPTAFRIDQSINKMRKPPAKFLSELLFNGTKGDDLINTQLGKKVFERYLDSQFIANAQAFLDREGYIKDRTVSSAFTISKK